MIATVCKFIALGLNLIGYSAWFIANWLMPDQKRLTNKWYGFAKIKEQLLFSTLMGFIGTTLCSVASLLPFLFPSAAWIFLIGNIMWTVAELHKLYNPPVNKEYISPNQHAVFSYTLTITAISLVTAIATSLAFVFPPATLPITLFSSLICASLSVEALKYQYESTFGIQESSPFFGSYDTMTELLVSETGNESIYLKAPCHGANLFPKAPAPDIAMNPVKQILKNANPDGHAFSSPL